MTGGVVLFALAACCGLLVLASGVMLMVGVSHREKRILLRARSVAAAYLPAHLPGGGVGSLRAVRAEVARTPFARVAGLLGFEPEKREHLPFKPSVLFIITGSLSVLISLAAMRLVGRQAILLAPAAFVLISRVWLGHLLQRVRNRLLAQFPDALGVIVRSVRVGVPVTEAVRIVAVESQQPTQSEFRRAAEQVAIGVLLEDALRDMAARTGISEYKFFATALALQAQTGGSLTETLETLADTIRKRMAARAKGHALAAEAKLTMYILAALPLLAVVAMNLINAVYMRPLFNTETGHHILFMAAVLWATGMGSMRLMIKKSLG